MAELLKLTFLHGCFREKHESGRTAASMTASMETMMETETSWPGNKQLQLATAANIQNLFKLDPFYILVGKIYE